MSIIELIFNFIFGIINFFIGIIPVISLPSTFTDAVATAGDMVSTLNWALPMKTIFQLFLLWIPLWYVKIYFKGGDFMLRHLPVRVSNSNKE